MQTTTEIDDSCSSTGRILSVEDTPFDLRSAIRLGDRWECNQDQQFRFGSGFNHNYVLRDAPQSRLAAEVFESSSGQRMQVLTNCPGMHFYTGNYLDGSLTGKGGIHYERFGGICFETQTHPDAIHHTAFPSPVLKAGSVWQRETTFRFHTSY